MHYSDHKSSTVSDEHLDATRQPGCCGGEASCGGYCGDALPAVCSLQQEIAPSGSHADERFRTILDSLGDAVIATDNEGRVRLVNSAAERLTGWQAEDAIGKSLGIVMRLAAITDGEDASASLAQTVCEKQSAETLELWLKPRDGQRVRIACTAAPIRPKVDRCTGLVLVFRDTTQQYEMQQRIKQAERLKSVSQLAGGVAHGFNNMLGAIRTSCECLQIELGQHALSPKADRSAPRSSSQPALSSLLSENVFTCLDVVLSASQRAEELANQLLAFGRKNVYASIKLDVHDVLNEAVNLLSRSISRRIVIARDLQSKHRAVMGDKAALQNAILGLGMNAAQAIQHEGEIAVSTRSLYLDESDCKTISFDLTPGTYCEITVRDNGRGMTQEQVERAFDPFFSPRSDDPASGLGLSAVYGMVQDHNGAISIESQPGEGASVRILLPVETSERINNAPSVGNCDQAQSRCILVVEDEEIVRTSATMVLNNIGYDTLEANDGRQALRVYEDNADKIDLVLLDINMPVMNGVEAYEHLREKAPELPIVFASGYVDRQDTKALQECPVIRKPYSVGMLQSMLASALDES